MKYQIKDSNLLIVATITTKDSDLDLDLAEGYTSELVDEGGEGGPPPTDPI